MIRLLPLLLLLTACQRQVPVATPQPMCRVCWTGYYSGVERCFPAPKGDAVVMAGAYKDGRVVCP